MIKKIIKTITFREWQLVILLSLFLIIVTTAPIFYGWLIRPEGKVFSGIHFAAPNDWFVYYSYLEQARRGQLLFINQFSSEPQTPTLNIFWLAVGQLGRIFDLTPLVTFQLSRILLIPVLVAMVYVFLATLFTNVSQRAWGLMLVFFSSGLGWLLLNRVVTYPRNFAGGQFNWPMDLWVPEAFTYLTVHYSPHFIGSLILILLIFWLTWLFGESHKISYAVGGGLAGLVLFAFHPFHVLTVFGVIGSYFLVLTIKDKKWRWDLVNYYLIFGLLSAPAILYYFYLLRTDPVIMQKAWQNLTWTTPVWITAFSYGLLLPLSLLGIFKVFKNKSLTNAWLLVLVWGVVQLLIIYIPVNWQRRMTEGLHLPLALFSLMGFYQIYEWSKAAQSKLARFIYRQRYGLLVLSGLMLVTSNVFQLAVDWYMYTDDRQLSYLEQDLVDAATWLDQAAGEVVFNSAADIINIVPAYSGKKVYVGHGVETPFFGMKQLEVNWFFRTNRAAAIEKQFLNQRHVDLIFYGPEERRLGDYAPDTKDYLKEVYRNSQVIIYQVL